MSTVFCRIDGAANALALNKDGTRAAVAGRSICKIFAIEENHIIESLNLKQAKLDSLNYSSTDVAWNPIDDNVLATSATNGAVVTWNLTLNSRNKVDLIFNDHRRTVNRVVFHSSEHQVLLTGSQDGTMKLFDLRRREATSTFDSQSESVRDVQFSPHQYFNFVAVQENGNVQFWDLRKADRWIRQFPAHNGPVFTCDWHPEEKKWLATAGRDKTIKIWDTTQSEPVMDHCIQTIASVAKVKWRPERKHHISSCSLVVDFSINIWDIMRPYIPFASFVEHKDVTTGICWKYDPKILVSTSKDKTIFQHIFKESIRPADRAIPVGIDVNNYGDISFAVSNKIVYDNTPTSSRSAYYQPSSRIPAFFRKGQNNLSEQFRNSLSSFLIFQNNQEKHISMSWFVESAQRYQLSGYPLAEMCENNAKVAQDLKRPIIAETWHMLKIFYNSSIPTDRKNEFDLVTDVLQDNSTLKSSRHNSGNTRNHHYSGRNRHISGGNAMSDHHPVESPIEAEEDMEGSDNHDDSLTNIASGLAAKGSFFFGEGDGNDVHEMACKPILQETDDDWLIPMEAFQPRNPIKEETFLPQPNNEPDTPGDDEIEVNDNNIEQESQPKLILTEMPLTPSWQFTDHFIDMLHCFAEAGDVQMSVSILLVLGDKISGHVEEAVQEQWFMAYIDLLHRFQLWNVATQVVRLSPLPSISLLNQESTTINSLCGKCSTRLARSGWHCDKCNAKATSCCVCHKIVRGLFAWCQGCGHGGHIQHLLGWFVSNRACPTGCGHLCEYT